MLPTSPLLLISSGAFSRDPDMSDYRSILRFAPQLDVDGIEVIFYSTWYADDHFQTIAKDLRSSGLNFPAVHAEKSIGALLGKGDKASVDLAIDRLNINCYFAQTIGAEILVLHLWGWPESDTNFARNLEQFNLCVDFAWRYRLWLAVETIPCIQSDPLTRVRQSFDFDPRSRVALDTEFLAYHNQLETAIATGWLWQDGRVMHLHVKDYNDCLATPDNKRLYLQPGQGKIDFPAFFSGLHRRGFAGNIVLESPCITPDDKVDLDPLKRSLSYLRELISTHMSNK
jgi:sugar phosphate isomerase/epimerase